MIDCTGREIQPGDKLAIVRSIGGYQSKAVSLIYGVAQSVRQKSVDCEILVAGNDVREQVGTVINCVHPRRVVVIDVDSN